MARETYPRALSIGLALLLIAITAPARSAASEADLNQTAYGQWRKLRSARPQMRRRLLETRQQHVRCVQVHAPDQHCRAEAHAHQRNREAYLAYLRTLLGAHRHAVYEAYVVGNLLQAELHTLPTTPRAADLTASSKRVVALLDRLAGVLEDVDTWRGRPRTPLEQTQARSAQDVVLAAQRFRRAIVPTTPPSPAATLAQVDAFIALTCRVMRFLDLYVENRLEIYAFHVW